MHKNHHDSLFAFDQKETESLDGRMAGVDEVGRGPLAGPVVAAAVIFHKGARIEGLNDSKKLTAKKRESLFRQIIKEGIVAIGIADEETIDSINILQAARLAMKRALLSLTRTPNLVLIDGNFTLDLPLRQKAVVKGDQKSASIAAASIVAKVYRDEWMMNLDKQYPSYQFSKHKGYPTPLHLAQLRAVGPSPVHRKSFGPVKNIILERQKNVAIA